MGSKKQNQGKYVPSRTIFDINGKIRMENQRTVVLKLEKIKYQQAGEQSEIPCPFRKRYAEN